MRNDTHLCHKVAVLLLLMLSTSSANSAPKLVPSLKNNGLRQAITQGMQGILFGTLIACAGLTGCERGELRPFADVLQERGEAEIIPTRDLFIFVDDKDYQGVIGKDGNGRIIAQTFLNAGAFVFMQQMEGTTGFSLDHHQYIGERVYLDGARDLRAVQRSGIIEEIFDNGYYLITIDSERYVSDGSPVALLVSTMSSRTNFLWKMKTDRASQATLVAKRQKRISPAWGLTHPYSSLSTACSSLQLLI